MIQFTISCHFADSLKSDFKTWVKTVLQKIILESDLSTDFKYFQLRHKLEDDLTSQVIQVSFENSVNFQQFELEYQSQIIEKIQMRFQQQVFTFVSVMELI